MPFGSYYRLNLSYNNASERVQTSALPITRAMKTPIQRYGNVLIITVLTTLCACVESYAQLAAVELSRATPIDIAKGYLRAIQARDTTTVYRYISSIDQGVRDEKTYLRSQETFGGFALQLAKRLAVDMEVWVIDQKKDSRKARFELGYRVPTGEEISSQLFDWNLKKLNSLPESKQRRLIKSLEDLKRSQKMVTIQGQETVDLIREKDGWRIFLDWPSRSRVIFKTIKPASGELEVNFLRNDFLVANNEPFQIDFTIKNRSPHTIVAKLNHVIEPHRLEKNLAMIACGALLPLRLRPGETQEVSTSYILGSDLAPKTQISITYEFTLDPGTAATNSTFQLRNAKAGYSDTK